MSKGQLFSKCPFGAFKSTEKTNEISVRISTLASKKRSNQKKVPDQIIFRLKKFSAFIFVFRGWGNPYKNVVVFWSI